MANQKLFIAATILTAAFCANAANAQTEEPVEKDLAFERMIPAKISDDAKQVVVGLNAFSLDIYDETVPKHGNHFISAASVSTAFGLAYAGSAGKTADQIKQVLHYPFSPSDFTQANGELLKTMDFHSTGRVLSVNNALWIQDDFKLRRPYLAQIEEYYTAGVHRVDYQSAPKEAARKINTWVAQKTNDKIKDLISPENIISGTRNILVNTVYFKSDWAKVFPKSATKKGKFKLTNGGKSSATLMTQTNMFRTFEQNGVQVLSMPYRGYETEMVVFLPKSHKGLAKFESDLNENVLTDWVEQLQKTTPVSTIVTFPRFKLESKLSLTKSLYALGMKVPFSSEADFSNMSIEALAIDDVIHQSFVEVDEKGTEAAAATALTIIVTSARRNPPKPVIFNANHPFFFLIRDRRTNAILFMGRLVDPDSKSK